MSSSIETGTKVRIFSFQLKSHAIVSTTDTKGKNLSKLINFYLYLRKIILTTCLNELRFHRKLKGLRNNFQISTTNHTFMCPLDVINNCVLNKLFVINLDRSAHFILIQPTWPVFAAVTRRRTFNRESDSCRQPIQRRADVLIIYDSSLKHYTFKQGFDTTYLHCRFYSL